MPPEVAVFIVILVSSLVAYLVPLEKELIALLKTKVTQYIDQPETEAETEQETNHAKDNSDNRAPLL